MVVGVVKVGWKVNVGFGHLMYVRAVSIIYPHTLGISEATLFVQEVGTYFWVP